MRVSQAADEASPMHFRPVPTQITAMLPQHLQISALFAPASFLG
jgi:hypothetical protein